MRNDLLNPAGAPVNSAARTDRRTLQPGFHAGPARILHARRAATDLCLRRQSAPDESDLRQIDKSLLPTEFADQHEAHFVSGADDYDELAKGRPIFHWFMLGALAFLLLESGFQFLIRRTTA